MRGRLGGLDPTGYLFFRERVARLIHPQVRGPDHRLIVPARLDPYIASAVPSRTARGAKAHLSFTEETNLP
jgi:hypothetical protein